MVDVLGFLDDNDDNVDLKKPVRVSAARERGLC